MPDFEYIDLSKLEFDERNPRIPASIDTKDKSAVLAFMLRDAGLTELMGSIAKQGFFAGEPLLVTKSGETDGYTVVEGNRRLAASLLLMHPEDAPLKKNAIRELSSQADKSKIQKIPCLVFPKREDVLGHLGFRHITGIKEWGPLAKARFLEEVVEREKGSVDEKLKGAARSIGSRSDYVGRLLTSLKLYNKMAERNFFEIEGLTEESVEFSLISSALGYADIVAFLGLEGSTDLEQIGLQQENWKFLAKFIFDDSDSDTGTTRLGESRNFRKLANTLAHPEARTALVESALSLDDAARLIDSTPAGITGILQIADSKIKQALVACTESEAKINHDDKLLIASIGDSLTKLADISNRVRA